MDYSTITETLLVGTTPASTDYATLRALKVTLVLNMQVERLPSRDHAAAPMRTLWLPAFDFPLIPIPIRLLRRGAKAALEVMASGGSVYAHCQQGVHRSVAMAAAILIAQGNSATAAMDLIASRRAVADPYAPHIRRRILKFAQDWQANGAT